MVLTVRKGAGGQDLVDRAQGGAAEECGGAVEFLAQGGDGVVLSLGDYVQDLDGEGASGGPRCRAGSRYGSEPDRSRKLPFCSRPGTEQLGL